MSFPFFCSSSTEEGEREELDSSASEENVLDETSGGTYLSMDEMGVFLAHLAARGSYCLLNENFFNLRLKLIP